MGILGAVAAIALVLFLASMAIAHDQHRPDLDSWYASLKRGDGFPCCNVSDCHPTEAELRNGEWWGKVGPRKGDGGWELLGWVKIPANVILSGKQNQAGEPVICHSMAFDGAHFDPARVQVYCFVVPDLS